MDREFPAENWQSDLVMSAVDAAYFAGFIDGEGTLTIVRSKREGRRAGGWQYVSCFMVANSDLDLLLSLRATCGNGRINSNFHRKVQSFHRTVYQLKFWSNQTRHVLPQVLPYLRGKRRQAELVLEYLAHTRRASGDAKSQAYWQRVEELRVTVANLNRRGGTPEHMLDVPVLSPSRQGVNQWTKPRESA